jgi:hypothetical protein
MPNAWCLPSNRFCREHRGLCREHRTFRGAAGSQDVRHQRLVEYMLRLTDFIIDCPDMMQLAAFYSEVTGRRLKEDSDEDWAGSGSARWS